MSLNQFTLGRQVSAKIEGQIVDLSKMQIVSGSIDVHDGKIAKVSHHYSEEKQLIMPGLIDAHMHVESTLLTPAQIGAALMTHGVLASVSDPHEIANVLGVPGIDFMLEDARRTDFKFLFGAPSCVPATNSEMETSGAVLEAEAITKLLARREIGYLAEVMNYPGVLNSDPELLAKIAAAKHFGKPIDGHAPGLRGELAKRYASHGISTDHECTTLEEALDKIQNAKQHILVREGSAARNLEALADVVRLHPDKAMLCTDDLHPDLAVNGSINNHVRRLIGMGIDPLNVLKAACSNPNSHYQLGLGQLQEGDPADFIITRDLKEFFVEVAVRAGKVVGLSGQSSEVHEPSASINRFDVKPIQLADLKIPCRANTARVTAIEVIDGQLVTNATSAEATVVNGELVSDVEKDLVKIAVINRYTQAAVQLGFVRNFGLKNGALASSVAHDCHNIIAVGANDRDLLKAINAVIENKGALSYASSDQLAVLPLPVAGLMSNQSLHKVAPLYSKLDLLAKKVGGTHLRAPFMTLSFLALIVIPALKLSDRGLYHNFQKIPLVE